MAHGLSFLKMLTVALCFVSAANANESFYVINTTPNKDSFGITYTFADSGFQAAAFGENMQASIRSHMLGLEFRRSLSENRSVWLGTQLVGRRISINKQSELSGVGLSDVKFGYQKGELYGFVTGVFGVTGSISPGLAQDPRVVKVNRINHFFSGTHSFAPYVGAEFYYGNLAVGLMTEVRVFSDIQYDDGGSARVITNNDRYIPLVKGFVEIPLAPTLSWGLEASVSRNTFAVDHLLLGGSGNQYQAVMYNQWKMEQNTALMAAITAKEQKYPLPEVQTDISLGLRKEM